MPKKQAKKQKQKQRQKQKQSVVVNITNPVKRTYSYRRVPVAPKAPPPSAPHIPHLIVERPTYKPQLVQNQDTTATNTLAPVQQPVQQVPIQQAPQHNQPQRVFTAPKKVPIQAVNVHPLIPIASQVNKLEMIHELKGQMNSGGRQLKTPDLRRSSTTGGMSTGIFASSPMMSALNKRREAVRLFENDENNDEWNDTGAYSITPLEEFKQPDAPYINNLADTQPQRPPSQPAGNQDKTYTCLVCNKGFSRQDALTRHYNTSKEHQKNLEKAQQDEMKEETD